MEDDLYLHLRKMAAVGAVTGLAALMLMGNTQCGAAGSGGGVTAMPVYAGLGVAPAGAGAGTWIYSGGHGNNATWILAAATGGAIAGAALAETAKRAADHRWIVNNQIINYPCKDKRQNHRIAKWTAKIAGNLEGQAKNTNPYLDCRGLSQQMRINGIPARVKYVYDCIAKILAEGTPLAVTWGKMGWSWEGGHVVAVNGRISEVKPVKGGWGACARA